MSEKEKMLKGELYLSFDEQLAKERNVAKELCYDLNNTRPSNQDEIDRIIDKLLGSHGDNSYLTAPFYCDYGYNISVGDNFYTNHGCVILDCNKVSIGNNVFIAPNVCIGAASHPLDPVIRASGLEDAYPITIGNDVWIGANVTILGGVTIGNNVVIGAGSLVNKDIPSNSVAVGVPCKVNKKL